MAYTYAVLEVSHSTYKEIHDKLKAAGYEDQFHEDNGKDLIDMHGIAIAIYYAHGEFENER